MPLDDRTRALIQRMEQLNPADEGLLFAFARGRAFVDAVPARQTFAADAELKIPEPNAPPASGEALDRQLRDVEGLLSFLCHAMAYKLRDFLDALEWAFERRNFTTVMNSSRALLEHYLSLHGAYRNLSRHLPLLSRPRDPNRPKAADACHPVLVKFALGTRLNWQAAERGDIEAFHASPELEEGHERRAANILNELPRLPQEDGESAALFYGVVSDYTHPNGPSHRLCLEAVEPLDGGRARYTIAHAPESDEALLRVIDRIAIPVRTSILSMEKELGELWAAWRGLAALRER